MDLIENDARMHVRVQEVISDSLERAPFEFSPEEIGEIIELIQKHIQLKSHVVELAEDALNSVTDKSLKLQTFLVRSLLADEKKHKDMLEGIERVRTSLFPYWPH